MRSHSVLRLSTSRWTLLTRPRRHASLALMGWPILSIPVDTKCIMCCSAGTDDLPGSVSRPVSVNVNDEST
eukprot:3529523-Prymnesium_polylepis.1